MWESWEIPIIAVEIAPTEAKTTVDALIDDIVDMAESYACLCVLVLVGNRILGIHDLRVADAS